MNDVAKKIRSAVGAIDYLPNGVSWWNEAHGGDLAKARENARKLQEAKRLMEEVLASLPTGIVYEVHGLPGDHLTFESKEALIAGLQERGLTYTGDGKNDGHLLSTLQGQPEFRELCKVHGGAGIVRYDTWELHERLSR